MTQEQAIKIAMSGKNIFLTGKAGTGKTYTLDIIIKKLRQQHKIVAITASTGIAATHLDGTTIHSWAGIGIKDALTEEDKFKVKNYHKSFNRIKKADVLIIDEISMLHDFRLDLVDEMMRFIHENHKPFGGKQIIVCGDFFQLSPVTKNNRTNYTYNAKSWSAANFKICYLEKNYRQTNDLVFIDILNSIRENNVSEDHKNLLTELSKNTDHMDKAINLYCKNIDVDCENMTQLQKSNEEAHFFNATTKGDPKDLERILKSWLGQTKLTLKKGSKVMFIRNNFDDGYCNGSMGVVEDFTDVCDKNTDTEYDAPVIKLFTGEFVVAKKAEWKFEEEDSHGKMRTIAAVTQIPLKLAYAITVHKSQGATFDYVNLNMSDVFVLNQGYVALSRIKTMQGLYLSGFNYISLRVDREIISKDVEFRSLSKENEINA